MSDLIPSRRGALMKIVIATTVSLLFSLGIPLTLKAAEPGRTPILKFESKGMKLERELMATKSGKTWAMAALPDGNLLATNKSGELRLFSVKEKTWRVIPGTPKVADHGQGGLLDVVLSSDFKTNKKIYLSYAKEVSKNNYTTALSSAELEGNTLRNLKEIFVATGSNDNSEHFGGRIVVDSESSIWLSVGERGERTNAQRLDNHLGKILRIDSQGKAHPDNPFINDKKALTEIYSYGHRNPQGLARNRHTKELWEHEHGPRGGDEINIIEKGLNYGWPKATLGKEYWGPGIGDEHVKGMEDSIAHWTPSIAPCGMLIYDGDALPAWKGLVLTGALAFTHLNITQIKNRKRVSEERLFTEDEERVREIEQTVDGNVWYSTDNGNLYRIRKI